MTSSVTSWVSGHAGASALILARVLGLCWTAPVLATPGLDWRLRLALSALLGVVIAPLVGAGIAAPGDFPGLAQAFLTEAVVGAALGWSAALIVAGARQAGELIGAQSGLSAAALFDPDAGDDLTPLGHWYGLIALAVFVALDGPLTLVRALVESYRVLPAGGGILSTETADLAFTQVARAFELALRAAAPVAVAVALAGVALGLLGRVTPALPLVALSLPVRWALGVGLIMVGTVALIAALVAAWSDWPGAW